MSLNAETHEQDATQVRPDNISQTETSLQPRRGGWLMSMVLLIAAGMLISLYGRSTLASLTPAFTSLWDSGAAEWAIVAIFVAFALPVLLSQWRAIRRSISACERLLMRTARLKASDVPGTSGFAGCEDLLFGTDPADKKLPPGMAVLRVFEEARKGQFRPVSDLVDREETRCALALQPFNVLQRVSLHLGILGTFLGLLSALQDVADAMKMMKDSSNTAIVQNVAPGQMTPPDAAVQQMAAENVEKFIGEFANFFDGLKVCFRTSVFGLGCWFAAVMLVIILRHWHVAYLGRFEALMVTALDISKRAADKDAPTFKTLSELRQIVSSLADAGSHQTLSFTHAIQNLDANLARVASMNGTLVAMNGFLEQHRALLSSESLAGSMQGAISGMGTRLEESLSALISKMAEQGCNWGKSWGVELRKVQDSLSGLQSALEKRHSIDSHRIDHRWDTRSAGVRVAAVCVLLIMSCLGFSAYEQSQLRKQAELTNARLLELADLQISALASRQVAPPHSAGSSLESGTLLKP